MNLGDRMKRYELVSKTCLARRTPVIIRIDGKAFHTVTKSSVKPFDRVLSNIMQETTYKLVRSIPGCVFGYSQSDEISLLLIDYKTFDTDAWFDYEVQKLTSISASIATAWFNMTADERYRAGHVKLRLPAVFDARVFNLPKEEVNNYFVWRQQDAERNSIQGLGQAHYSQNELHGISCKKIITKLEQEKNIIWGDLPTVQKRGFAYRIGLNLEVPIFSKNPEYINNLLEVPEPLKYDLNENDGTLNFAVGKD